MKQSIVFALLLFGLAACQPAGFVECADPRPTVCTMEYRPVCGNLVAGGEKTYSSGCNACADVAVASHQPSQCPETPSTDADG